MDTAVVLRHARGVADLTQAGLARRAGTSQSTLSAYESGRKQPSVSTLARLLAAAGARLTVELLPAPVVEPTPAELTRAGRTLLQVIELAEALPTRHPRDLRFPRLRSQPLRAA